MTIKVPQIKTTSKLVVCSDPRGVSTCWPLKGVLKVYHRITTTGSRLKRLFSFAYFLLLPVNGSIYSFREIWSLIKSSSSWFQIYSSIIFAFFPTVSTKYPRHQKFRLPYLYFKFACLSNIISALLLLSLPINCDTLIYGGILTRRCMWSGHASPSIISTFISLHNFLIISMISWRTVLYITFLRYFGANTTWYSHR